jgi:hypothetical protein
MLDSFDKGQTVELNHPIHGWDGKTYTVLSHDAKGLVRITNTLTGSKQWVSTARLRLIRTTSA